MKKKMIKKGLCVYRYRNYVRNYELYIPSTAVVSTFQPPHLSSHLSPLLSIHGSDVTSCDYFTLHPINHPCLHLPPFNHPNLSSHLSPLLSIRGSDVTNNVRP